MNYFRTILAVLAATFITTSQVRGASLITATITVTNTAGIGTNWIVNGNTRTWTNAAGSPPSSWITTGANVGATATNLYNSFVRYPYTTPFLSVSRSSTNVITLRGITLSITTNNYFSVSYVTNTGTNINLVYVPFENIDYATNRTNQAHWLVDGLNRFIVTNSFTTNSVVASNFLTKGASPYQEVLGPIGFRGRTAVNSNFFATNGFTKSLTNVDSVSSNHVNFGSAIRSEGAGGNSLQVGSNALAKGDFSLAIGNSALASNLQSTAIGIGAQATELDATALGGSAVASAEASVALGSGAQATIIGGLAAGYGARARAENATALGNSAFAYGYLSTAVGYASLASTNGTIAIGEQARATGNWSVAIGRLSVAGHSNSAAIGPPDHAGTAVETTTTNQIRLGTANHTVSVPGILQAAGISNLTTLPNSTNLYRGDAAFPRATYTSLSSAGAHNTIVVGTNVWMDASGAAADFPLGGLTGGARDGKWMMIRNVSGYTGDIYSNDGSITAIDRITTLTGTNMTWPNGSFLFVVYDATTSRWVMQIPPMTTITATATNALSSVATNGVFVLGSGLTNINWTTGVTGYVSGGTAHLGVSASGGGDAGGTNSRIANIAGSGTNLTVQGLTVNTNFLLQTVTASRVAIFDASKQLTNSAAVDTTELEYLDGVTSALQPQLDAKGNFSTNANGSAVFQGSGVGSILVGTTNQAGYSNYSPGIIVSNTFTAPSNTVQEVGIVFDTSTFQTGTAATNVRPRGEFKYIPSINAVGAPAGTWVWQTRTNVNGPPTTNLTVTSSGNLSTVGGITSGSGVTAQSSLSAFVVSSRSRLGTTVDANWTMANSAGTDFNSLFLGGITPTNGQIQFIASSTGNSNMTVNLRSGNTNTWMNLGVESLGTHMTNWTADAASFVGYTNTTAYNQIWNIRGTSGNIVFWNRTGLSGATAAGVAIWTNTIISSGRDIVVGVNCGIAVDTGVSVVGGGRAF